MALETNKPFINKFVDFNIFDRFHSKKKFKI